MRIKWFFPGIIWFVVSFVLLSLPGNDLPDADLFGIPYIDKWIHTGMFLLLTFLFSYPFTYSHLTIQKLKKWSFKIALCVIIYGVAMEYYQKYFSPGRSFDLADIFFDSAGSLAGMIATSIYYTKKYNKKIGPDGNRGRNQN